MGVITNLVRMKSEADLKAKEGALGALRLVMSNPDASPAERQWAQTSLVDLVSGEFGGGKGKAGGKGKSGGIGDVLHQVLGGMQNANPFTAGRGTKDTLKQIGASQPEPGKRFLSEEDKEALTAKQTEAAAAVQRKIDDEEAARSRKQQRIANQEAYEERVKQADTVWGPGQGGRDRTEFLLTGKFPTGSGATGAPRVVYGKIKGQETEGVQPLSFNPRDPSGYIDVNGRTYTKEQVDLTGPPAPTDRLFGRSLEISKIVEGEGYKRGTPEYDRRFGEIAQADIGTSIAAQQQRIGIAGYESGIGAGTGIPPDRTGPPPANTPPTSSTPQSTTPAPSAKPRLTPRVAGPDAKTAATEDRFVSMYIDSVFGNQKPGGGAANIGIIKGRDALRKRLGVDPITFSSLMAGDKAEIKGLVDTVERKVAIERVNNVLSLVGDRVIDNAKQVTNSGSPWLTKPWRKIERGATGDPALEKFLVDMNEMMRQYTTLTAGGALSRAMLPEGAADKVEAILDPNSTLQEVIDQVGEVKQFGKMEQAAFATTEQNRIQKILGDIGGKNGASGSPIVQRNKKTKQYRYSTDGGQTWQPGQPPATGKQ